MSSSPRPRRTGQETARWRTSLATAKELRAANWKLQRDAGIDLIPSNDFSLYDQVLDTIAMVGAVPERYGWDGSSDIDLDTYFAMARGRQTGGVDVTAMEMTKWFDTNYHYIVPELERGMKFRFSSRKPLEHYAEAKELGIETKPVLVGPLTFLLQGKCAGEEFDRLELLDDLVDVYAEVLAELGKLGAEWVQIDEPVLVEDRTPAELEALERAYKRLAAVEGAPKIVVATYFDHVGEAYPVLARLPVAGVSLDFVYGPHNRELVAQHGWPEDKTLFAGVVNGRNVWINDLAASLDLLEELRGHAGDSVVVSTSCSLQHSPVDKRNEPRLDDEVLSWMSFAVQKLDEVAALTARLNEGRDAIFEELEDEPPGARGPAQLAAHAQPAGARAARAGDRRRRQPRERVLHAPRRAARAARAAAVPDHDDRLVPADDRDPHRACAPAQGRDRRRRSTWT